MHPHPEVANLPFMRRRAQAVKPRERNAASMNAAGNEMTLKRRGGHTIVRCDGKGRYQWATREWVPAAMLDANERERNAAGSGRAPLGDKHGCWQKIADNVPVGMILGLLPPSEWQNQEARDKAMRKFLNDPDNRAFRTDADHRTF